jgi:hypothetical protein
VFEENEGEIDPSDKIIWPVNGHLFYLPNYDTSREVAVWSLDQVKAFFSIYIIRPAAQDPGVYLASNRNEYQKQKNKVSLA